MIPGLPISLWRDCEHRIKPDFTRLRRRKVLLYTSTMLTLEQCKKLDPSLRELTDEELGALREAVYLMARVAYEAWVCEQQGSKPSRVVSVTMDRKV